MNLDLYLSLTISSGREHLFERMSWSPTYIDAYLTLLGWNRRITIDEFREHATQCFDTQGEWGHIEKKEICDITTEHTTLRQALE